MFFLSKSRILTSTSSPTFITSVGLLILPQLISVICSSPVIPPPMSINAPKSVILRTTPLTISPLFKLSRIACFSSLFFSSTISFLETTIFLRETFILTILNLYLFPTRLSAPPTSCMDARLAGRKASNPTSTIKPPLTFRATLPSIESPSL